MSREHNCNWTVAGSRVLVLASGTSATAVLERLRARFTVSSVDERFRRVTFHDTFDARLHATGLTLIRTEGPDAATLALASLDGDELGRFAANGPPAFAWNLPESDLRERIVRVTEMRRLLPVLEIEKSVRSLGILDDLEKTVVRVTLERGVAHAPGIHEIRGDLPELVRVTSVRGYPAPMRDVVDLLEAQIAPTVEPFDELGFARASLGQPLIEFPCKLRIRLNPEQPAHEAVRSINRALLDIVVLNEDGMRRRVDTEFLHDFRVSVRRTRSALTQIKGVFPKSDLARFKRDFAWLGSVTGPARDADVFLLKLPQYRERLPEATRADLEPLQGYLEQRQRTAYRELVKALNTRRYPNLLRDWRAYLDGPAADPEAAPNAERPVLEVATERIGRVLRNALKMGAAIDDDAPAAPLHELRIQCKKLRYLLGFYASLYDQGEIAQLTRALKKLQDNLGDFNDCAVQQDAILKFARDMVAMGGVPVETFLAMGRLEDSLMIQQERERRRFGKRFARFTAKENRQIMRRLFAAGRVAP